MFFLCRISKECTDVEATSQARKYSMSALTEVILREALRKRLPGSISNDMMFGSPRDEIRDVNIVEKLDKMVKASDKDKAKKTKVDGITFDSRGKLVDI